MRDLWDRIETALDRIKPKLSLTLHGPADAASIERAEAALGGSLPDDYRASARIHDGMFRYLIDGHRLLRLEEVIECRDLAPHPARSFAIADDRDGDARKTRYLKGERAPLDVVQAFGGTVALTLDGEVVTPDREVVIAPSFHAYLEAFATSLEQGRYRAVIEDRVVVALVRR